MTRRDYIAALVGILAVRPAIRVLAQDGASVAESITYRFENDKFLVPRIELVISDGSGRLVFERRGLAAPVSRDVRVGARASSEVDSLLARLNFLGSSEVYQTREDHSNLGTTTISVRNPSAERAVSFNYTANADMAEVASLLRGVANREIYRFDIETAARYQPLELPKLLEAFANEMRLGRITEPAEIAPLIEELADDPTVPLIGRNQARKILDAVAKSKRAGK